MYILLTPHNIGVSCYSWREYVRAYLKRTSYTTIYIFVRTESREIGNEIKIDLSLSSLSPTHTPSLSFLCCSCVVPHPPLSATYSL